MPAPYANTLESPTANGPQTYSGLPGRPRAIWFLVANHGNVDGELVDDHHKAFGFACVKLDGTIQQNGGSFEPLHGQAPTACAASLHADSCISVVAASGGTIIRAQLTAVTDDGFTLEWINTFGDPILVSYLAVFGDFPVAAGIGASRTSLGTSDITLPGFEPDSLMIHAMLQNNTTGVQSGSFASSGFIGFGTSAAEQFSHAWRSNNGSNPHRSAVQQEEGKILAACSVIGTANFREASLDSFLSNGFRLNWTTANLTAAIYLWSAFRGLPMKVGRFAIQAAAGIQTVDGIPFRPEALMLFSHNRVATVGRIASNRLSWGVTDGTRQFSIWGGDTDLNGQAAGTLSTCITRQDHAKLLELAIEGPGVARTLVADCTFNAFGADNFSVNWANTGGGGQDVMFVALGSTEAAGSGALSGLSGINPAGGGLPPYWTR